jgi:hypothetical protein
MVGVASRRGLKHLPRSLSGAIHAEPVRSARLAAPALMFGLRFSMSVCLVLYVAEDCVLALSAALNREQRCAGLSRWRVGLSGMGCLGVR